MLKKLKRKQGISLPLAMAITAVLIILSASLIAIAATSIMNTSSSVNQRQAYLNVRSALEYATAYYSDKDAVPKIEDIHDEYMVMNDKEGGTTSEGAKISSEAESADYATFVVSNYYEATTTRDEPSFEIVAYSRSQDAFGKRTQTVSLKKVLTIRKSANKNRVTLTDIDMNTEVLNYNTIRDAITLHVKQYPGENWTPFYYLWTYRDHSEMYAQTGNCYGLETEFKNTGIYYNLRGEKKNVLEGFNENEKDYDDTVHHKHSPLEPASVWNVIKNNSADPRNGTTSYFTPTGNGWYDATYYIINDVGGGEKYSNGSPKKQVNYFNIIITAKGKVLNNTATGQMDLDTQTNEMFHLWYLNNSDRNIYFEFLKPGMRYTPGSGWNGIQELDDRILVYVKNQKTTVHFKVKGIGDTPEEAVKSDLVSTPIINDIRISGVNLLQVDHTYDNYSNAMSSTFYGANSLEQHWRETRNEDMKNFFFGIGSNQNKMMYEGCGWWVANISTGDSFSLTITYYDKEGKSHTGSVNVSPNSESEAFVVADLERGALLSRLTESRANELLGVDDDSYSTIRVKASEIDRGVAPYIDYKANDVSSAERRELLEAVEKGQTYVKDDYEDASFNVLSNAIDEGIALYNKANYIKEKGLTQANEDYKNAKKKITDAIAALRTKACSPEVYAQFEQLVERGENVEKEQGKNKSYDGISYRAFISDTGIYKRCKALRDSGDILDKDAYTTSRVYDLISQLRGSLNSLIKLDKTELNKKIKEAKSLINNSRFEEGYRNELSNLIPDAEHIAKDSTSQNEIQDMVGKLSDAISAVKSHLAVHLDTETLVQLISQAEAMLDPTKEKANCTDETYNTLKNAAQSAQTVFDTVTSKQEDVDAAVEVLRKAIDGFTVHKPGYADGGNLTSSTSTDYLSSHNIIRIWVKGMNKGSTIPGYQEGGSFVDYEVESISFSLEEYVGVTARGMTLNSESANVIDSQNLSYFDIDVSSANGFKPTIVVTHYIRSTELNPATGTYPIIDSVTETYTTENILSCSNVTDGNFVIEFDHLGKAKSTSADGKEQVINTLYCNAGKLSEYYVKAKSDTKVQVSSEGRETEVINAVQEGNYFVVRFVDYPNQTATLISYDPDTSETIMSDPFEAITGQYVMTYDESTKRQTNVAGTVFEKADSIEVGKIYPRYSRNTGSGSSSSYQLNGIVSDSLLSGILSLPDLSSTTKTPFDYFAQVGVDSTPTINLGTTIIWIDTNSKDGKDFNQYFKDKPMDKLRVYAWDYNDVSLTGKWPGIQPIRVAESRYYYLPVNSSAQGCVLSFDYGGNNIQKIGCNELVNNYNGNIYFDRTDYKDWSHYTDFSVVTGPAICAISGKGFASLYEKIDEGVLDGTVSYQWGGGRTSDGKQIRDGYAYRAPGKVEKIERLGSDSNKSYPVQDEKGDWLKDDEGNLIYRTMEYYSYAKYYYRAIPENKPQIYDYDEPVIDKSEMTASNLRMAFVGGNKIRLKNNSYYYSYGPHTQNQPAKLASNWSDEYKPSITDKNLFGGNGGNGESMGRVGDTEPSLVYDWYEYKIPVDKSNTYMFQVCGLKYNPSYAIGVWSDPKYKTDNQYTEQISGVYGDVWLTMLNTTDVKDGKFTGMNIYTSSPENMQINDNQDIYVRLPGGWSANDLKVTASGVGEDKEYTFTSYNGLLKTSIPSKTPFLVFEAKDASGNKFTCRTSLQGNDLILFDPTFRAGTGGWDNYVDPAIRVERELYAAHAIYYGSVIVKEYTENGTPKNLGDQGSYKYAEGMKSHILDGHFDGQYVNNSGRAMDYSTVHSYVVAYTNLYATMAKARAYISGHNYPEYLHNGKPDIYEQSTIDELERQLKAAEDVYTSSSSDAGAINAAAAALQSKINNVTVSTSDRIPIIFFDTQNLVGAGSTFELEYCTDPNGSPVKKKIENFNTEHCPIIFIGHKDIYNVKFIVNGSEEGVEKDHISVVDGAWVYMDIAKKAGVTTSYWVQNSAADYRQISNTEYNQVNADDKAFFDMVQERKSSTDVITDAKSEKDVKAKAYRPITLYFKNDVTVKLTNGTSYKIRAGAYSFTQKQFNTTGNPIEIVDKGSGIFVPRINLYSEKAKTYFEDPESYWKYAEGEGVVDATELNGWVTKSGDNLDITAGSHNTTKTVNMTVNNRSFAANRTWSYMTKEKFYFRWEGNSDLKVNNTVKITAEEIRFASSGTVDVSNNYDKHIYFATPNSANSMEVVFPTDIHVEYIDKYREEHSFTIREGSYTVEKADTNQNFICDLCDEEYWESMVHVKINNRFDALGGFGGNSDKKGRFSSAVYSND